MTIELVSYANLQSVLSLEGSTIASYSDLSLIRDNVVHAIEAYIGRTLGYDSFEKTIYITTPTQIISLPALPVFYIDSITITDSAGVESVLSASSYHVMEYGLYLHDMPTRGDKYVIEYDGGYEDEEIPGDIKRAALLQTVFEFQSKDHIGAESVSTDGGHVSRPQLGLLNEVKRMLDGYKHPLGW